MTMAGPDTGVYSRIVARSVTPLPQSVSETLQGRDIVDEVLHNSEQGQFEFSERVIVPAVYHIYLHPDDLDRLESIVPAIQEECKNGLNKRLKQLNRKRLGRKPVQYGIHAEDWEIRVLANYQDDAAPGSVKVVSSLAPAQDREFVGAVTVRVKRPAALAKAAASSGTAPTAPTLDSRETKKATQTEPGNGTDAKAAVWGRLEYKDDAGEKNYELRSATTVIGRGSAVDVVIRNAGEEVSRQHCRIRREASGETFVSDLGSANGTLVDGVRLAPKKETALPPAAIISLANGAVILKFTRRDA
jgi:hypothetical protein